MGLADQRAHASIFECVRLCSEGKIGKNDDPIFLLHFFNVHIMNVNYAKFPKKFDSRTISRELP